MGSTPSLYIDTERMASSGQNTKRQQRTSAINVLSYKPVIITDNRRQIEDLCRDLHVNNDHTHVVEQRMRAAIAKGLRRSSNEASSVKCFPTYVKMLPSGEEVGKFLALDLGGTNFRVLVIEIGCEGKFEMDSEIFAISQEMMRGPGDNLFDYIAKCLADFIRDKGIKEQSLPLGFTFSFPCKQEGLAVGRLVKWTKGFKCSGVEGEDVVRLLKEAIDRRGDVNINTAAIINDTTGCLMSSAWKEPKCRIGLILGTGTNACYLEDVCNIETIDHDGRNASDKHMVINTEWGAFGEAGELDFIKTKWDLAIDEGSLNPGKQIYEKMISGMYMGELTRQVLMDMVSEGLMFQNMTDRQVAVIYEEGKFLTKYVSEVEGDPVGSYRRTRKALEEFGLDDATDEDCSALRYICELVSRRAAYMAAAGIAALLKKMDYKDVVVAVDGSLFRYHPHFYNLMRSRIAQLMGVDYKFDLMLSTDGSGRGAALVAAVLEGVCKI